MLPALRIKDIMTSTFAVVTPHDDLRRVASLLRTSRQDSLPVLDRGGALIGIMTKANLFDAIAEGFPVHTPIDAFFTRETLTLREDLLYEEAARVVRTSRAGNAVILDEDEHVTGVFAKADWIMAMFKRENALNAQLQAILDMMPGGLLGLDCEGVISTSNHTAQTILGFSAEHLAGEPLRRVIPDLDMADVFAQGRDLVNQACEREGVSLLCDVKILRRDGRIYGAIVCFQDLSDLKRVMGRLHDVTEQYDTLQQVMDFAYDGIYVVDGDGCISMVNRAAAQFFRKRTEEMIGRPVDAVVENTRLMDVISTAEAEINELQYINGTPYVVSRQPIVRDGRVIGAVGKILFRNLDQIRDLAEKLGQAESDRRESWPGIGKGFEAIITADPDFLHILEEAQIVCRGTSNILITGESGTGKELVADAVHRGGPRRSETMVRVNCAAIPASLMESEFFGYVPGSFTGAARSGKQGRLSAADGGTLFLDEIGDLPMGLQGKLLRVLQDRSFEPIGSTTPVRVDVRIIAATNQNLEQLVAEGRFRADLYYRLNVIHLHLPPLRSRPADIPLLVQYFLRKYNEIFSTAVTGFSAEVEQIFRAHGWPGNVRELENVIERAINFARGTQIVRDNLPAYLRNGGQVPEGFPVALPDGLRPGREDHEREMIHEALQRTGGNKAAAARLLGISRSWLYEKLSRIDAAS